MLPAALNFVFPNTDEKISITLGNGVINYVSDTLAEDVDATVTVSRQNWNELAANLVTLDALLSDGRATVDGDVRVLTDLFALLDDFEIFFNIVEP